MLSHICPVFLRCSPSKFLLQKKSHIVKTQRRLIFKQNRCLVKMSSVKIGTHNGTFHCDEVLACYMLRQLPEYKDAEIIRTRDPVELAKCDVVVDVGGVYDPKQHRYDHHQRSFKETFKSLCPEKPWVTKLSSAGLVYLHFGRRILSHLTQLAQGTSQLETLHDKDCRMLCHSYPDLSTNEHLWDVTELDLEA